MKASKGFAYSLSMLFFMLIECSVLIDMESQWINASLVYFFSGIIALAIVQIVGIILVYVGHYRVGGTLQIIASAAHVLDLIGVLGIVGGLKAYRYPERLAELGQPAVCSPD